MALYYWGIAPIWSDGFMRGEYGNDIMYGLQTKANNEKIDGGVGNDTIYGFDGNDILMGGYGNDYVEGGNGNDSLYGGDGDDNLLGGEGQDLLWGDSGNDSLFGNYGDDKLYGGNGSDQLFGGMNNDYLEGNAGSDILVGGIGKDILIGGSEADNFILNTNQDSLFLSYDVIKDLQVGVDKIDALIALTAAQVKELGNVNGIVPRNYSFTEATIQKILTPVNFGANSAATFSLGTQTFLAINDGIAGFSASTDAIIEITGYSGSLVNLAII